MDILPFVNKWIHLTSMIAVLGSVFMMLLVVLPVLGGPDFSSSEQGRALFRRYGMITGILWLVLLATGFYNYLIVSPTVTKGYHMVLGMKIAAALLMFLIAVALSHPLPVLAPIQKHQGPGLVVLAVLGILIVGISAHLNLSRVSGTGIDPAKRRPPAAAPAPSPLQP